MRIVIEGVNLPGRSFRNAGVPIHNVHVGVQVRDTPTDLVAADQPGARWVIDVRTTTTDAGIQDFAGPAVHGRRGDRFIYLTWGDVGDDGSFAMFRRAKLMLNRVDPAVIEAVLASGGSLYATVDLTDGFGGPRCARVDPPAISWACR